MLDIRKTGLAVEMATVDFVRVPAALLDEVKEMARASGRVHFIGVMEEPNPDFVDPEPGVPWYERVAPVLANDGTSTRLRMTGEFVVSSDRAAVLEYGCGRLVWVTGR